VCAVFSISKTAILSRFIFRNITLKRRSNFGQVEEFTTIKFARIKLRITSSRRMNLTQTNGAGLECSTCVCWAERNKQMLTGKDIREHYVNKHNFEELKLWGINQELLKQELGLDCRY
jgi:hypothetical protein